MVTRILFDQSGLTLPRTCPNCGISASSQVRIKGVYRLRKQTRISTFSVPMCQPCQAQRRTAAFLSFFGHIFGVIGFLYGAMKLHLQVHELIPSYPEFTSIFIKIPLLIIFIVCTRLSWVYGKVLILILFRKLIPRGIDATHAAFLDVVSFSSTWLVIRDDTWAQMVRGGAKREEEKSPPLLEKIFWILFGNPYFFIFRQYKRSKEIKKTIDINSFK